ncbi:UNVERIFIED_CONTAM: restriction endonuclease subunit S [Campylobacter lari]
MSKIKTGKKDANFASKNGKYIFFTCSTKNFKCDEYEFDESAILIAGNGNFNVKFYKGKFNAYQRTYILTTDAIYEGLLYLSSLFKTNMFQKNSSGSIIKFITLNDIENIDIFIPEDVNILFDYNDMLYLVNDLNNEIELLENLRDFLLPLLMNGQAKIS